MKRVTSAKWDRTSSGDGTHLLFNGLIRQNRHLPEAPAVVYCTGTVFIVRTVIYDTVHSDTPTPTHTHTNIAKTFSAPVQNKVSAPNQSTVVVWMSKTFTVCASTPTPRPIHKQQQHKQQKKASLPSKQRNVSAPYQSAMSAPDQSRNFDSREQAVHKQNGTEQDTQIEIFSCVLQTVSLPPTRAASPLRTRASCLLPPNRYCAKVHKSKYLAVF